MMLKIKMTPSPVKGRLLAKILWPNNGHLQLDSKQTRRMKYNFANAKMKCGRN